MSVTLLVSNPLTSKLVKLLQPENILLMLVTLLMSNPLTSKLVRLLQPENILPMLVTLLVSNPLTSKLARLLHPRNMPDESVIPTTSIFAVIILSVYPFHGIFESEKSPVPSTVKLPFTSITHVIFPEVPLAISSSDTFNTCSVSVSSSLSNVLSSVTNVSFCSSLSNSVSQVPVSSVGSITVSSISVVSTVSILSVVVSTLSV